MRFRSRRGYWRVTARNVRNAEDGYGRRRKRLSQAAWFSARIVHANVMTMKKTISLVRGGTSSPLFIPFLLT